MLEVYLRPIYQSCLADPAAKWLGRYSPVQITYLGCLTGILVGPALLFKGPLLATLLLLLSGFLDSVDGTVARANNKTSPLGGVLDNVCDRIVELAVIVALFAIDPVHRAWPTAALLGSCYLCITSFLAIGVHKAVLSHKGTYFSPSLVERAEAFFFFVLMMWFPHAYNTLAYLFSGLVLLTAYLHVKRFTEFSA